MQQRLQALAAEAAGTGFLVAAVVGSGIMAERLSGGNTGLALLANMAATGAILYVLIGALGPLSGAHFNPAVSLAFRIRRDLAADLLWPYIVMQVLGGVAGTLVAHMMFELPLLQLSGTVRNGPAQWFSEFIAAFGLMSTILLTLRARPEAVPVAVGLYICAAYWFTASTSFANPAVTIARALTDTFSGIAPVDVPAFIVAQCLGTWAAAKACGWILSDINAD